jgi:hypothetical protein
MKALPNNKWRDFVYYYVTHPPGHGAQTRAARAAGFCKKDTPPSTLAKRAWTVAHDPRAIAAIAEQSKLVVRAGAPEAVAALYNMIRTPEHKDHARAVAMVIDRVDPAIAHQAVSVTHQLVDVDTEALEELRALRKLGAPREKMLELFGPNGLDRIERLEAADNARRADAAKVIEGAYTEVSNG